MFTLLAVGTVTFWIVSVLVAILLITAVEQEAPFAGLWLFALYIIALELLGSVGLLSWLRDNPGLAAMYAVMFLAIGAVWAVIKWTARVNAIAAHFKEARVEWLAKNRTKVAHHASKEEEDKARLADLANHLRNNPYIVRSGYVSFENLPLRVADNKQRIITWMAYWPLSLLWALIDDFVRKVFENIYTTLKKGLQSISDRSVTDLTAELDEAQNILGRRR